MATKKFVTSHWIKLKTYWRLGLRNLWRVGTYRLALKLGVHPVQQVRRQLSGDEFFKTPAESRSFPPAPGRWLQRSHYFGWYEIPIHDQPPHWHQNIFTGQMVHETQLPWWKHSDFHSPAGDIKTVWESSRMDWVLALAQNASQGTDGAIKRLNAWLTDWIAQNPAYLGPNWKCGQEASIRVLHLLLAWRILEKSGEPAPALVSLIEAHLARIAPTLQYAVGQDNNHATSEAAALAVAGDWLARHGVAAGRRWHQIGRRWLENRVQHLISVDGSFSQHSINYHRLMLDTLSLVEMWRQTCQWPRFSKVFYQRLSAATLWLHAMTDPQTGDAPNLGANDGANLLPLTAADYRDYRPSVQLAMVLFNHSLAYTEPGPHDEILGWLEVEKPEAPSTPFSEEPFHARGYMKLQANSRRVYFRYPYYRFRPGHCDALHVDFWHGSNNILRDAGSYSYNSDPDLVSRFTGPQGHNTVQFDGRDSMPALGPFLRGAWLRSFDVSGPQSMNGGWSARATYKDWMGAIHCRQVFVDENHIRVEDKVEGFRDRAVLRWHLCPGNWEITSNTVHSESFEIVLEATVPIISLRLVSSHESRFYHKLDEILTLEVEIQQPGVLVTEISSQ